VTTKSLYQKLPNTLLKASGITPAAAHGGAPGAALVQSLVLSVLPGGSGSGAAAPTSSNSASTGASAGGGGGGAGASTSASNYEKKIKDKQLTIENAIKSKGYACICIQRAHDMQQTLAVTASLSLWFQVA
jgi:hypothetical protein